LLTKLAIVRQRHLVYSFNWLVIWLKQLVQYAIKNIYTKWACSFVFVKMLKQMQKWHRLQPYLKPFIVI